MSRTDNRNATWRQFLPHSRTAWLSWLVVAIAAFSLGLLLAGGDGPANPSVDAHDHEAQAEAPSLWTCSMHPQIKLPEPGKCPLCFMDLIPLESDGGVDVGPRQLRMSAAARQLARIETTPVRRALGEADVRLVGKVAYDESTIAYITAWVPGRLDRLYADYTGMAVKKGEHLVSMYSPELLVTQEELLQAGASVEALSGSSSRLLHETAVATLAAARDKLQLLGLTEAQIRSIEQTGVASDHLTITAPQGGVVVHKNAVEGMYVETGTQIYTIADLSRLWMLFEAYESDLPWLRYGQHAQFTSPSFPGEVFTAIISFIDPVVDPQTRTIQVRAIVQNEEGRLKPDMFVSATVHSQVDGAGRVVNENLAGKWISPMHPEVVKDGPGTCDVCGMDLVPAESYGYATAKLTLSAAPLLIPASAPLITGRRAVVYVEIPDQERPLFEGREVELGPRAGDFYVVRSGLAEGELVVTNGAFKIDAELQIQAKPSMMSPERTGAPQHQHSPGEQPEATTTMQHSQSNAGSVAEAMPTSDPAAEALAPIYNAYFSLQAALAADDSESATAALSDLVEDLNGMDMKPFTGIAHRDLMTNVTALREAAEVGATAPGIEPTRAAFDGLSVAMIGLHERFGHTDGREFFQIRCPMAFNNRGADWLQTEDVVHNPYFGARMLRCGTIQAVLESDTPEEVDR